ncbi:SDR family oxidoreductase [Novosphingobium sp. BL-52-GroH]|uniref:SDR family oxidoreductase n=1 Tax=Novosphingobium sp. BL-52-GroH TaxID=3349877 RepID=UPI00384F72F3
MKQFEGKTALVSGSSQGIGKAVAIELARRGAAVTINYPRESDRHNADAVLEEIAAFGGKAVAVMADIMKVSAILELFDGAEAAHGKLDFVIANAGGNIRHATFLDTDEELFDAVNALNAKSTFFMFREGAKRMNDGGRLIGLSSSTTRVVYPGTGAYAGCKSAIEMYCKTLSKEVGHRGITVNSVAPGMTVTEGLQASTVPEERYELVKSITPLGRLGVAQDVGNVILMLLGDDAGWVTGQHVNAGGGAFH